MIMKKIANIFNSFYFHLFVSIIFSYLIVTDGFPYLSLAVFFAFYGTVFYLQKTKKTWFINSIYALILFLSAFLFIRSNPILIFFNISSLLVLGGVLVLEPYKNSIITTVFSPIITFFESISKNRYPKPVYKAKKTNNILTNFFEYLYSNIIVVLFTIFLSLFVSALLTKVNPIYKGFVDSFLDYLSFSFKDFFKFLDKIFNDYFMGRVFIAGLIFTLFTPVVVLAKEKISAGRKFLEFGFKLSLLLPKVVLSIILTVFVFAQIKLYTASPELLSKLGYTNSQKTNEVFYQLLFVSLIIFLLIYNDRIRKKLNEIFTYILITFGLLLDFFALRSDLDYINLYGFTFKRLYGIAIVIWILGLFLLFIFNYFKKNKSSLLVKESIIFTATLIIGINFANFDYMIAHKSPPSVEAGTDYNYIIYNLSNDGMYLQKVAEEEIKHYEKLEESSYRDYSLSSIFLDYDILKSKYGGEKINFRTFNLSEYRAFKKIDQAQMKAIEERFEEVKREGNKKTKAIQEESKKPSEGAIYRYGKWHEVGTAGYYYERGFDYWRNSKDYKNAEKYYKQALEVDPNYPPALSSLGMIKANFYYEYDAGIEMMEKAHKEDASWPFSTFNLAITYHDWAVRTAQNCNDQTCYNLATDRQSKAFYYYQYTLDNYKKDNNYSYFLDKVKEVEPSFNRGGMYFKY